MSPAIYYVCGASLVIGFLLRIIEHLRVTFRLRRIPTVGSSSTFSYYPGALEFRQCAGEIIQEGYKKVLVTLFDQSVLSA